MVKNVDRAVPLKLRQSLVGAAEIWGVSAISFMGQSLLIAAHIPVPT